MVALSRLGVPWDELRHMPWQQALMLLDARADSQGAGGGAEQVRDATQADIDKFVG